MSVSAEGVWSNGVVNELVYPFGNAQSSFLSQLEWETGHVFSAGSTLKVNFLQKFSFYLSAYTNLNPGFGRMRNKDWLNSQRSSPTHFSESFSRLEPLTNWRTAADFHYRLGDVSRFSFFAGLGFTFYRWNFYDRLISYRYPPEYPVSLRSHIGKTTVRYQVNLLFPHLVLSAAYEYRRFAARLSLRYGFLAHVEAVDNHDVRGIRYNDRIFPGHYLGAGLDLSLRLNKLMRVLLGVRFGTLLEAQGYTVIEKPSRLRHQVRPNRSGISALQLDVNTGLEFELF